MRTEREETTRKLYDLNAEEWLAKSGGRERPCFWSAEMQILIFNLEGDKNVLEVGCGPATDGKYLHQMGANVLSTDYSRTMLKIAKELNPKGRFMKMDMEDLHFLDNTYDGFWATACLLHLDDPNKALSELVRVTKKGGVGFISVKEGEGMEIDPRTGYSFHYFKDEEFKQIIDNHGMEVIVAGRKAGSPNHDWLTYVVRVQK